ncbi:MAG TPA: hypothetical protein VNI55_06555 [Gaiellaceae bacterium]|nr:hypothetical protein [Gaiellaceae bacterium]
MYEHGQPWTIVGPDGTVVDFNTLASVFKLEEVTGFDSARVRTSIEDRPEYDGAVAGNSFLGSRPVTMSGKVVAESAAARNLAVVQLQRALRALRSDLTMKSQASGLPAMQAGGRIESFRVSGGYVKEFQLGIVCADPRIYSQVLNSLTSTAGAGSGLGAPWPIVWPAVWGGGSGAEQVVTVVNVGNIESPPVFRAYGPITNPEIRNTTTGTSIWIDNLVLAVGEWVDVDVANVTVVNHLGVNLYDRVRFPTSVWSLLSPGTNNLELRAVASGSGVQLTVSWRDAWA